MSKIFTSKNYQNLINKKVGTNTPFSKLFKDLRCQIFPLWSELNLKLSFYHYNKLSNSIMSNYDWIKFPNQVYLKCIYVYVGCIIFIIFHPSLFLLNLKTLRTHLDLMWFKLVISFGSEKCRAFYQNIYCNRLLL